MGRCSKQSVTKFSQQTCCFLCYDCSVLGNRAIQRVDIHQNTPNNSRKGEGSLNVSNRVNLIKCKNHVP